jgi:hypothetical protein
MFVQGAGYRVLRAKLGLNFNRSPATALHRMTVFHGIDHS